VRRTSDGSVHAAIARPANPYPDPSSITRLSLHQEIMHQLHVNEYKAETELDLHTDVVSTNNCKKVDLKSSGREMQ